MGVGGTPLSYLRYGCYRHPHDTAVPPVEMGLYRGMYEYGETHEGYMGSYSGPCKSSSVPLGGMGCMGGRYGGGMGGTERYGDL